MDLSHLKSLINAGEPVTKQAIEEFLHNTEKYALKRIAMVPSFGMAECATCFTYFDWSPNVPAYYMIHSTEFVNLGKPMPGTAMRIVNREGEVVLEGSLGELEIKGKL